MRKKILALMLAMLTCVSVIAGCGSDTKGETNDNADTQAATEEKQTITIGCMPLNKAAVDAIAELVTDYNIEVVVFDGNNLPAEALMADEIDSLILNHLVWIKNFNKEKGAELTMVDGLAYASIFGLYSSKYDSIDQIPDGARIIVSNDPANMDRSLRLLEKAGLIKLGEKTGDYYTVIDIAENTKNLELIEVETTMTAGSFEDADASIAFSSVMLNAGYDPDSYLIEDGDYVRYPTGLFVNKGDEDSDWAKAIIAATQTEEYETMFNEAFHGAYRLFDCSEIVED